MTKLQSVKNKLSEKINNIKAKLLDLHNAVKQTSPTVYRNIHQLRNLRNMQFSSFMSSFMNGEEKEKEKRQLNLIANTQHCGIYRRQFSINLVDSIPKQYLGISAKIERTIRLGKCTDKSSTDKPRLLKISVSSEHDKAKILRTCTID